METPDLATEWTEAALTEQRQQWQAITALSGDIAIAAEQLDWDNLLELADQRQTLVAEFFQSPIYLPLFQQISIELNQIQDQHKQVLKLVQQAVAVNEAKTASLQEARDVIEADTRPPHNNH
tara:strand:+ start:358 stop:723 length:366 start_codon:yes stop_codon:yes gene_type:complete